MKTYLKNNKPLKTLVKEVSDVAGYLWQRGWAERNAGNISVNISDLIPAESDEMASFPYFKLPTAYPKLSGMSFFISGKGKRMRDLARKPLKNALIIKLDKEASGYWIISHQTVNNVTVPTSELFTHLGIHQMIAERNSTEKVVIHAHTTELIVLTMAKEFCEEEILNRLLWNIHPETALFVPKGIGFVPYILAGTVDIATETRKALQTHDVALWEKHGVFAIGTNVSDTFDIMDILAKSARIFLMCRSAQIVPDGFSEKQLAELRILGKTF